MSTGGASVNEQELVPKQLMLFGNKLEAEMYAPWKEYYLNYTHLKKLLKEGVILQNNWSDKDEQNFVSALDSDLEKVYTFQSNKYDELNDKLNDLQLETETPSNKFDVTKFSNDLEAILQAAQELNHFQRLNYTGFIKIVKKHDRLHPQFNVKPLLNVRLKNLPFHSEDYSPLIYKISALFQFLRENYDLNQSLSKLSSFNEETQDYQIYKFWVHPDNLMEVKATILRHLPVLVYNRNSNNQSAAFYDEDEDDDFDDDDDEDDEFNNSQSNKNDPIINCLYFDNPSFELYNNRLVKNPNASTLRLKWIGKLLNKPKITFEKKNFDQSAGNYNVDEKFPLKEKHLNSIINGTFDIEKFIKRSIKKGESDAYINDVHENLEKIVKFIKDNNLQPTLRTVYKRTAFQIPGDDKVRIVIDSDLVFIREDSFDSERPIRDPKKWHRTDIDSKISNPFSLLRKGEYSKFPYAELEIKIKAKKSNRNKKLIWVDELVNSGLVKEIPGFSKFVHGISTLFLEDDKLDNIPLWFNELEADLKLDPQQAYIDNHKKLLKQQNDEENLAKFKSMLSNSQTDFTPRSKSFSGSGLNGASFEPLTNDKDSRSEDEDIDPLQTKKVIVPSTPQQEIDQTSEDFDFEDDDEEELFRTQKRGNAFSKLLKLPNTFSKLIDVDSEDEEIDLPVGVVKPDSYIKNAGPLKIEPKVWLANERTFNRWLHVTTLLSSLTFIIYSSTNRANSYQLAETLAYIYFALTLFSGLWGYYIFIKRRDIMMERSAKHLDNVIGPLIVAIGLIVGLVVNFVFGFRLLAQQQKAGGFTAARLTDDFYARNPIHKSIHEFIFSLVGA